MRERRATEAKEANDSEWFVDLRTRSSEPMLPGLEENRDRVSEAEM